MRETTRRWFLSAVVTAVALAAAAAAVHRTARAQEGGPDIVTLTLVPNRLEQSDEIRINTGRKATLSDGSYNTVYELKKPGSDRVFLSVGIDVYVENGVLLLDASQLRLRGANATQPYLPIDWYKQDGLVEIRESSLAIADVGSIAATFEVPRAEVEQLTFVVGALEVGTVPSIVARLGRQE